MSSSTLTAKDGLPKTECDICCGEGAILTSATVEDFMEGQEAGCLLCEVLGHAVTTHAPGRPLDEPISICHGLGVYEMVVGKYDPDAVKISVYGHDRPNAPLRFAYEYKGMDNPPSADTIADITGDTSSSAAMDKIRGWIDECDDSHEDCNLKEPQTLPTRVLDVGSASNLQVRLYETGRQIERYVCLSHCWGRLQPLTTTKETIEARKQGINWDALPPTFQDAVTMTRNLGIRYLWIDSLCIIQGDHDDWQRESAKMHTVYQGAYLTLAASWGSGPRSGLFRNVPPEYRLQDWDLDGQHIRTRRKIPHVNSGRDHPLMRRGWVFQERLLSRRVLHFTATELAWECMADNDCECGNFEQVLGVGDYELAPKGRYRPTTGKGPLWLALVWWKVVMDYSRTQLTLEKDIFPALSGVAELQRVARDLVHSGGSEDDARYYAGLWSDSLTYDLLWHVPKTWGLPVLEWNYDRTTRPSKWRAPSWSWASVKSPVKYDLLLGFESKLDTCEVDIQHLGDSTTGQVEEAALDVSGMFVPVTLHKSQSSEERQRHREAYLKFGDLEISFEEDYDIWGEPPDYGYHIEDGDEVYCLLVGKWFGQTESDPPKDDDKLWFMVLINIEMDIYERIGVATIPLPGEKEQSEFEDRYLGFLSSLTGTGDIRIL